MVLLGLQWETCWVEVPLALLLGWLCWWVDWQLLVHWQEVVVVPHLDWLCAVAYCCCCYWVWPEWVDLLALRMALMAVVHCSTTIWAGCKQLLWIATANLPPLGLALLSCWVAWLRIATKKW